MPLNPPENQKGSPPQEPGDAGADREAQLREVLTLLHLFQSATSAPSSTAFYTKVLDLIETLFKGEISFIFLHDRKRELLQCVASRGLSLDPSSLPAQRIEGALGTLFLADKPTLLRALDRDPTFCFQDAFKEKGIRRLIGFPLKSTGRSLGVLCFYTDALKESDDLTAIDTKRIDFLSFMMWGISTRIENILLTGEITDRLKDSQTLLGVSQSVSSTLDLAEVFRRIARETARYLGADMVGAYQLDAQGEALIPIAGYAVPKENLEAYQTTSILVSEFPFVQQHLETQRPGLYLASNPRFKIPPPLQSLFPLKSFLFIPMMTKGRNLGGLFVVWWKEERYLRPEEIALIEAFSRQAAIAAENAELYHALDSKMKELTQLQTRMIQTEKLSAIGELISGVAHELNNPLTSILGFADIILKSPQPDTIRRQIEIIRSEAGRSAKIIQSLLTFARTDPFEMKKTDLLDLLTRTLEIKSHHFSLNGIEVVLDFQEGFPQLLVDDNQIQQVFLNILNNAHQALMEKKGDRKLTIKASLKGAYARIAFSDNGPGIASEILSKIFHPFFTTKPIGVGTGLGLSVSYGIVKAHGGNLFAESRTGEGAHFYLDLPIESASPLLRKEASSEAERPQRGSLAQKEILILDDEAHILEMLQHILTLQGAEVSVVSTASEALALVKVKRFDLILTDVKMPEMDGFEFYQALIEEHPALANKIIFLTGDLMNLETRQVLNERGCLFLKKPFQIQELNEIILRSLENSAHEDEGGASL